VDRGVDARNLGAPSAPVIGLKNAIKGIDLDDPITKYLVRLLCAFDLGLLLAEIDPSTNPLMHKIYVLYHIPAFLAAIVGACDTATGPLSYAAPATLGIFLLMGLV
jgi:hypothetical protein